MVGVNSYTHRFGTVAFFATLLAALHVTYCDKGCTFDFEYNSDFDFECNNQKNLWTTNEDAKESPNKKILILTPEQEGCFKTKNPITLNATSPVALRFYGNEAKEDGKLVITLIPKEGSCPDDECVWNVNADPQYKAGEWVTAEYKFPLKSSKEYYVQLQVGKGKGKFLVDSIVFPTASGSSVRCSGSRENINKAAEDMNKINLASQFISPAAKNGSSIAPNLADLSKNLMLTSASVITLNNIIN